MLRFLIGVTDDAEPYQDVYKRGHLAWNLQRVVELSLD